MFDPNMKTAEERKKAFQKDFDALLEKHGAEVCIAQENTDWAVRHVIEVHQKTIWEGGTVMADFSLFHLDV